MSKVDSARKTGMRVKMMQTYIILTPLSNFTPSLSFGGENAPCGSEMASQR